MTTRNELEQALTNMPDVAEANVVGEQKLIATVISETFRDKNEAERQEVVWDYLRRTLGDAALDNIEFVLTNTQDENAA